MPPRCGEFSKRVDCGYYVAYSKCGCVVGLGCDGWREFLRQDVSWERRPKDRHVDAAGRDDDAGIQRTECARRRENRRTAVFPLVVRDVSRPDRNT